MIMKSFVALALIAVASSSISRFNPNKEQTFLFSSQVLTGIPELNSQYAGLKISGQVVIQTFSDMTMRIKLQDVKYKTFNDVLQLSEDMEVSTSDLVEVPSVIKNHLQAPFKVVFDKIGNFQYMHTEAEEPEIVTNLKKSLIKTSKGLFDEQDLANMLNKNTIQRGQNQMKASFKTMETSTIGECEVEYSVNKLPEYSVLEFEQKEQNIEAAALCQGKEYYEIFKVKNLENCKERPLFQHTYGANSKSDGSQGATSPYVTSKSSVERTIRCGGLTEYPIYRKLSVENKFLTSGTGQFEGGEKIEFFSKMSFVLKSSQERTTQINDVVSPKVYHSLIFEFPSENDWISTTSAKSQVPEEQKYKQEANMIPQIPLPDMVSAPNILYPNPLSIEETKQFLVETFLNFLDVSKQSPESSYSIKNVNGQVVIMTKTLLFLSYADIQEVWTTITTNIQDNLAQKDIAQHVFLDLLSIPATNPCVKYISEMVKTQAINGEPAVWIVANMIRSIKAPTEEVLQELTGLLKHPSVQSVRSLKATVALALSQLVHKACIDETSSVYDYPAKIFGKFCTKDSDVIKKDLLPFLVQKLQESKTQMQQQPQTISTINSAIVYINALGNLGIDEASYALLEVVEGKMTAHPHLRSLAVYKLIRSAQRNPAVYRPVILSIIHNVAESEEVRMAAISALTYAQPSSVDFQKLAIMTWFEPSQQVSSYISSTLKSLKNLPMKSILYQTITKQAEQAYKLARPVTAGIQTSHNIKIGQFLETLKSTVNLKLQYVTSEESAVPRNFYIKSDVETKSQTMETFESAVYFQGSEVLIEKLYDLYKLTQEQQQLQKPMSVLNINNRASKQPEAHFTLKMLGLQRFYSIDSQLIQEIIQQLSEEFIQGSQVNGVKRDFLKVLDLTGYQIVIPTEAGIPLHIKHRTPLVISGQASLLLTKKGEAEIKIKPVVNYGTITTAGIVCPFTKQFLGAGVDTALHVAAPLAVDLALTNGQLSVTLKTPADIESQKQKPVIDLKVRPYTMSLLHKMFFSNGQGIKTIHSQTEKRTMEVQLGEKIGVDLKLKMQSEHQFTDLANFIHELSQHKPLTLLSLPLPLKTVKSHSVSLVYNPSTSTTKEAFLVFSFGYGKKESSSKQTTMVYPTYQEDQEIARTCKQQETGEEKLQVCMKEKFCTKQKEVCRSELGHQNRPSSDINKYCSMKFSQCSQRHVSRQNIRSVLSQLTQGSAVTFNIEASLRGDHEIANKKIETHFTIGQKPKLQAGEKSEIKMQATLITSPSATPYDLEIQTSTQTKIPTSKWDKEAILQQDPKLQVSIKADFGMRGQEKMSISADLKAVQSVDQKMFAKTSSVTKKCESEIALGQKLSKHCKMSRTYAASLDEFDTTIYLPTLLCQNLYVKSMSELVQAFYLPYMSIKEVPYLTTPGQTMEKYVIQAKVHQLGQRITFNVLGQGQEIEIKDLRLGDYLVGLLPLRIKEIPLINIIEKLTAHGAPSTCTVEGGKVSTFDKVLYEYQLNDCEHVIFKDCSPANKLEVSVKKSAQTQYVKVIIDNNKYELELMKPTRTTRASSAVVKVNGEKTDLLPVAEYYLDQNTYLTSYEDGVFAIVSKLYGMSVHADSESIEVKTFQHSLRNQACGLCGDLNDEKTADIKSAGYCLMSSPKLAAYSYMVADTKCQGIPVQDQIQYQLESDKCIKKEMVPTKVTQIINQKPLSSAKHLVQEHLSKICISKLQVNICGSSSVPKEVIMKQVPFFCVSKDTTGTTIKRMAELGEKIQNVERFPTEYIKLVSQPINC